MDDLSLRSLFHSALDEVTPPKPWLWQNMREQVHGVRDTQARRAWWKLSPTARRLVAAVLIIIVAGTAAAATIAIYEQRHKIVPVVPRAVALRPQCVDNGARMFDPKTGWNGSSRTTDGGKTWHDVSPPSVPNEVKGGGSFCAIDATHAWATAGTGSGPYQQDHIAVMSTQDGGQSWQQVSSIAIGYAISWKFNSQVEMGFFDDQHGWLLFEYVTVPIKRTLYATSDGGAHWSVLNRAANLGLGQLAAGCNVHGLTFESLQRGWLTWDCFTGYVSQQTPAGGAVVATTGDGGKTWVGVALPAYPAGNDYMCGATSPIFDVDGHGVMQVRCGGIGHAGWDAVYSTADNGRTWAAHPMDHFASVDFLNPNVAFYFWQESTNQPSTLYRTDDAGARWSVVASGLFPGSSVGNVTFLDEKTGFVGVSQSPAPWWTHDGGKTWSLLPPYRSAGNAVCGTFRDPGAGNAPRNVKMVSPTVGWATGTRRTADGGAHWMQVAPPAPKDRSTGYGEFFLDATHAWVVDTAGTKTACADHFVTYATTDGGTNWQQLSSTPVPDISASDKLAGTWNVSVEFVDAQTGWLLAQPVHFTMSTSVPLPLYKTSDGGRSWTLATSNGTWTAGDCTAVGLPDFSSRTTGWIGSTCTGAARSSFNLLVTQDGGMTWTAIELIKNACTAPAYPDGCPGAGPTPQFVDASHGWLLDTDTSSVLMTADGGLHWTRHALPHGSTYTCQGKYGPTTCSSQYAVEGAFLTPTQGWLVTVDATPNGPPSRLRVEQTLDGGRTWSVIYTRGLSAFTDFTGNITFVDAEHGFWWLDSESTLFSTSDGGHSWHQVHITYT